MKKYVTWEDVENFVAEVQAKYQRVRLKGVYALPRGGLVFGVMISHRLKIPLLSAPCENCMIVDDICDSGESLLHYYKSTSCKKLPYEIVTMYYKPNIYNVVPDFYVAEKGNDWIVFPWEEKEE